MNCHKNNLFSFYDNHMVYQKKYNWIEIDLEQKHPITKSVKKLQDLIDIGESNINHNLNIDINILRKLIPCLKKLNNMIGLEDCKQNVITQLLYFLNTNISEEKEMLHTIIQGSPGCGKTEFGKILGNIYKNLGILSKGNTILVKRSDLIGNHLGETCIKTQKVLDNCKGNIMFIDEAYSLGSINNKDSFSKECIDTITSFLTENKDDFILILAGYKDDIQQYILNNNQGLDRRFNWRYDLKEYNCNELKQIFLNKITSKGWNIDDNQELDDFFKKNYNIFKNFGGDIDTLFYKAKMEYCRRVISISDHSTTLLIEDLEKAISLFSNNIELQKNKNYMMYC